MSISPNFTMGNNSQEESGVGAGLHLHQEIGDERLSLKGIKPLHWFCAVECRARRLQPITEPAAGIEIRRVATLIYHRLDLADQLQQSDNAVTVSGGKQPALREPAIERARGDAERHADSGACQTEVGSGLRKRPGRDTTPDQCKSLNRRSAMNRRGREGGRRWQTAHSIHRISILRMAK